MSLDANGLARLEAAARMVPGVDRAVALLSFGARASRPRPPIADKTPAGRPAIVAANAAPTATDRPLAQLAPGPVPFPAGAAATLGEALHRAAAHHPDRGTHYVDADGDVEWQSYPSLLAEAQRVLGGLRSAGLRPGDAALFQFDRNRNYITTFWACVLGGFLPTPVAVAPSYQRHNAITRKLHNTWRLLDRPVLLTDADTLPAVAGLGRLWEETGVRVLATEDLAQSAVDTDPYAASPDDPALHLLTSGSTGVPKCVQHTHRSIAARTYAAAHACRYTEADITMNWMPLDHVAIVMYNVRDVFLGCAHVNAKITTFLARPLLWLDWIDRYRATNTWAPNFAYAMVNERAADVASAHWDLSCMRAMTNAAEPVIARTAHRFLDLLAPHGLPADAMRPCWGMSETCSGTTYGSLSRHDRRAGTVTVDQGSLAGDLRLVEPDSPDAIAFTEVGPPIPGLGLRITNDRDEVLPEDHIGQLQTSGDVMMRGYHANAEANRESYTADGWFRTGDLAFLHRGSLVITGREKDQIIVHGVNYVAHEIEAAVEQVEGVELTFVAAGGVADAAVGSDRLALFFVPTGEDPAAVRRTVASIRARLVRDVGLAPAFVVPVAREEFPKTGSGKIQRGQLLGELRRGTFDERLRALDASVEPDVDEPGSDGAVGIFERVWRAVPAETSEPPAGWLVLIDDAAAAAVLRAGLPGRVVTASTSPRVDQRDTASLAGADHRIDPRDPTAYERLLAEVGPVGTVVHAWCTAPMPVGRRSDLDAALDLSAYSIPLLLRALHGAGRSDAQVLVVTTAGLSAGPGDRTEPAKGGLSSLVRTATEEAVVRLIRQVDLEAGPTAWPTALRAEAATPHGDDVVAYRGGVRLAPRLRRIEAHGGGDRILPRTGGRYLITGGLGGIGFEIAQYLLAAFQTKLLLIGRSPQDDPAVTGRLAELAVLGPVRYAATDVAEPDELAEAVRAAEADWGAPLDGVLHLAGEGIADQWDDLARHTLVRAELDGFRRMYHAKVYGTWAITELLRDRPRASLVLFSSVNGEFGGTAFGAYASANGFLQAFADHWHERGRTVRTLAWSMWRGVGMNASTSPAMVESRGFRPVDVDQGIATLLAALAVPRPYLVMGLDRRNPHILRHLDPEQLDVVDIVVAFTADDRVSEVDVRGAVDAALPPGAGPIRLVRLAELTSDAGGVVDRDRLRITLARTRTADGRGHVPPATTTERRLADIWARVLGRRGVGRHETFFELGGGSLQAAQVIAEVNSRFTARLGVEHLYEHPTVEVLAHALESVLREEEADVRD